MTYMRIPLFLCCAFVVWSASVDGLPHSSFHGTCTPNNSSDMIYSQVINIRNSGIVQRSPQPIRRWMNSVRDIFRRGPITTTMAPTLSGVRISQMFTYPPFVSIENAHRYFRDLFHISICVCIAGSTQCTSNQVHSNHRSIPRRNWWLFGDHWWGHRNDVDTD